LGLSNSPEEFSQLLVLPGDRNKLIQPFVSGGKNNPSNLLGIPCSQIELKPSRDGSFSMCPLTLLYQYFLSEDCFHKHENLFKGSVRYWSDRRMNALAFAVLGSKVFPGKDNYVDCRMGPILDKMDDHHTLVPMILGEVMRSLSFCSTRRRAFFFGCAALLQVWFLEHLTEFRSIRTNGYFDMDIINHYLVYCNKPNQIATKEEWIFYLNSLTYDKIVWKARWLLTGRLIMRCGEHHFVPLLGMHGMAAYSPSRVVRQYGLVQPVPMVEDMSAWFFDFTASNSKEQVKKGQRLWQLRRYEEIPMGEGDDKVHNYKAYRDYHLWIEASLDKNPGMVEDENPLSDTRKSNDFGWGKGIR
jgi:hypothetical protein